MKLPVETRSKDPAYLEGCRELARSHADALYRWAWSRVKGNEEMAREIVQRSFLSAFERLRVSDPVRENGWGWLLGLAMNHLKRIRKEGPRRLVRPPDAVAPEPVPVERDETRWGVRQALTELPMPMQRILVRHYVEGKPVERLAEEMGVASSTAWMRLSVARAALKKALGARGIPHD